MTQDNPAAHESQPRPQQKSDQHSVLHRPWLCGEAPEDGIRPLLSQAFGQITCSALSDAEALTAYSINGILLTEFASDSGSAARMAELSDHVTLTNTIDHFYHAELLSRAACVRRTVMQVVIEVDLGAAECGSRPGYDTQRLAVAADRLQNLRVIGLTARLACDWYRFPHRYQREIQDAFGVLAHTAGLLTASGVDCSVVSVQMDQSPDHLRLHPIITETRGPADSPPWDRPPATVQLTAADVLPSADCDIETRVMSRPSLTTAILQTGFRRWIKFFPQITPTSLRASVTDIDGARIHSVGPDRTVILVSGAARDLTIGERVTLRVEAPENTATAAE